MPMTIYINPIFSLEVAPFGAQGIEGCLQDGFCHIPEKKPQWNIGI